MLVSFNKYVGIDHINGVIITDQMKRIAELFHKYDGLHSHAEIVFNAREVWVNEYVMTVVVSFEQGLRSATFRFDLDGKFVGFEPYDMRICDSEMKNSLIFEKSLFVLERMLSSYTDYFSMYDQFVMHE